MSRAPFATFTLAFTTICAAIAPALADNDHSQVLGGSNAPAGKWPDITGVYLEGEVQCTGTLIAPNVVITAGHCNDPTLDKVIVGSHDLSLPGVGEIIPVSQRFEYPDSGRSIDVTVLKLARDAKSTPRKIASGWASFAIKNNAAATFAGYGAINADADQYVPQLQEAVSSITDAGCSGGDGCNSLARPNGELGAGGMGIDTCPGDSGGPLYVKLGEEFFLAGVTSRSYNSARKACEAGGIYGRPDKIVDWIERQVGGAVAKGPAPEAAPVSLGSKGAQTKIIANDPIDTQHDYAIVKDPVRTTYNIRDDGTVKFCAVGNGAGTDELIVQVADKNDASRALNLTIKIDIAAGSDNSDCSVSFDDDSGCGCKTAQGSDLTSALLLLLVATLAARRRTV
jgi:MYXO-CTERM domain-containing protein